MPNHQGVDEGGLLVVVVVVDEVETSFVSFMH